ncbi:MULTISPECIES: pectinesterase family protein [Niastella]|uniref:Carbohydrate-binding protein n=1 Tax=Niastella soli TaxID=2821487 RepID=A0ABS3YWY2_9BACT|nr:pectinesterase family protein [Niastella soli]MBO9202440.1 carbohydrate-binding protein [Niastella soli]
MKKILLMFSLLEKNGLFFLMYLLLISLAPVYAQYDIVVAKDGSGNYSTVQAAINAAPSNSTTRTVIYIKNGSYYEVLTIPTNKTNLTFIGQSNTGTVLTYDNYASKINPATGQAYGTSNSASTFINGAGFYALNIAFANSAGPVGQAVAVRCTADKAIFKNCRFLGNQDTYYAHSGRAYHEGCYFEGTTDFVFGGAIGWFENCDIYSKGGTSLTAANTAQNIAYGYVFNNCRITGAGTAITDLGRPWGGYASVTFRNTSMSAAIKAAGWNDWGNSANQATARFSEYSNSGSGYVPASRPSWVHILTASQASAYTMLNVLKANNANPQVTDNWNPLTTIKATGGSTVSAFSTIQAESYSSMSGVQTETCSEGGSDVAYINNGDWIRFGSVNFGTGVSGFSVRVASNATGGTIKFRLDAAGGTQIGACNVANTGGWQTWTTVTGTASGVTGVHDLYLSFSGSSSDYLFNLNHFVFTASGARLDATGTSTEPVDDRVQLFPSPADQEITIAIGEVLNKDVRLLIFDNLGRQVLASTLKGNISKVPVGNFVPGTYIVRLYNGQRIITKKFLKK